MDDIAIGEPITEGDICRILGSRRTVRRKSGDEFLRGPIPLPWLARAAALRGKALAVGIAIWFKHGATKGKPVKASASLLDKLKVNRKSGYRALESLESAGLINVQRQAGRAPIVNIVAVSPAPDGTISGGYRHLVGHFSRW